MRKVRSKLFSRLVFVISLTLIVVSIVMLIRDIASNRSPETERNNTVAVLENQEKVPRNPAHHVLFLYSYDPSYITADLDERGIRDVLYPANITYDTEYLNANMTALDGGAERMAEEIRGVESRGTEYDAVILGDDEALRFAETYQKSLFPDTPLFFFGVNDISFGDSMNDNPLITGVTEKSYVKETIELAEKQMPKAESVVAVVDDTASGAADQYAFQSFQDQFPELSFSCINSSELTREELSSRLEQMDRSTILLYFEAGNDVDGNSYTMEQNAGFFSTHSHKTPVWRPSMGGIGSGFTGGFVSDSYEDARATARMCVDVLEHGKSVSEMEVKNHGKTTCVFDSRFVRRFHIKRSLLPRDTVYINQSLSYWDQNKHVLIPLFLLVLGILLFAFYAFLGYRRAAISSKELEVSNGELTESHEKLQKLYDDLEYASLHDRMTGLLSRDTMQTSSQKMIDSLEFGKTYSIIAVDIDDMKEINDTYGHVIGDNVIKEVSIRLQRICNLEHGILSRYGGDEFVLCVPGSHTDSGDGILESMSQSFADPVYIRDARIVPAASVGVAVGTKGDGRNAEQQMINADIALYQAKHSGKNTVVVFEADMQKKMEERSRIRHAMLTAFRHDGFYMLYQPKVSLNGMKAVSFEALVRMKDRTVSPALFVPLAEESGWVTKLGRITTELVIKQLAAWKREGKELIPVSVNYSPGQLSDTDYVTFLRFMLDTYDIDPSYIQIEITETLFMKNVDRAMKLFQDLRATGIRLLMDDFGSGYSNLEYLSYIPVDYIKIDKTLIDGTQDGEEDSVVSDIIRMAHNLKKITIAEGVETRKQLDVLLKDGCDEVQGYYFDRPLNAEDAGEVLRSPSYGVGEEV